jgi:hypothetical protein
MNKPKLILLTLLALGLAVHAYAQGLLTPNETLASPITTNTWQAVTRPTRLFTASFCNSSGTDYYILVFATNSAPGTGAIPTLPAVRVPANSTGGTSEPLGAPMRPGCAVAISTTPDSLTNSATLFRLTITHAPIN